MQRLYDFYKPTKDPMTIIWIAIMGMQQNILECVLEEDIDYEDVGKDEFIAKLQHHFRKAETLGDREFLLNFNYCMACNCEAPVCTFIGNRSGYTFSLYFEVKEGKIIDIYHCNLHTD